MKVKSFYFEDHILKPLELELVLWPGLPVIQFVGQADQALKESALRIKSAIKASGFDFPIAQQILVNLKPTHVKKSSRGLELAVALAYLWATEQIADLDNEDVFVYGELGLSGQVEEPADLRRAPLLPIEVVITGEAVQDSGYGFSRRVVRHLSELSEASLGFTAVPAKAELAIRTRPQWQGHEFVSDVEARLLEIVGVGGHHILLAGPSGAGKSALAKAFYQMLPEISPEEERELILFEDDGVSGGTSVDRWRPLIEPHHSTPKMAMIGGGSSPRPGEIARAHRGILILDELLEFESEVLESLRGPFETGDLRVGRLTGVRSFKADCLIVGTTNLCPCGDMVPGSRQNSRCRFSLKRCQSYSERLSGPLLDRFQILHYPSRKTAERRIAVDDILERVLKVQEMQKQRGDLVPHRRALGLELWKTVDPSVQKLGFTSQPLTERRRLSALRVARSLADLEGQEKIGLEHFNEAMAWSVEPFHRLNRWQIEMHH